MGYFRKTIEQIAGYTPGFQPKSPDVVKLNTNENPWPCSPKVLEAIGGLTAENLQKYPEARADSFRSAAAGVLEIQPDNIICTNGGDDLLTICFRAFCDADRPVAFAEPTYSLYPILAGLQGCEVVEAVWDSKGSLNELAKTNAPLTIVCNPNAPTCDFISIDALAALARQLSGVLLIDEAYVDFAEDNAVRLIADFDNVIILRSMSKGYSLAGIRFGYGIANAALIEGLMKVKDSYNVDAMAIAAATAAIGDQAYFKTNIEKIIAERGRLTQALRSMGFDVTDSQTNFVLAQCTQQQAKTVYEALTEKNIFVRYFSLPGLEDKLRITIGTPAQNDKLLAALTEITG
ncbi:MAG: histidinol-phosphate transaminase [Planctomycetota bacterium]